MNPAAGRRPRGRGAARSVGAAAGTAVLIALAAVAAFRLLPPLAAAEATAADVAHALFRAPAPTRDDIALVLIEESTLALFPYRSPIDRAFLAELVVSLAALGPRAIGLDILLDQGTEPEKDLALLDRISDPEDPPVVVVTADGAEGLTQAQAEWLAAATAEARTGQAAILTDGRTGVARAIPAPRAVSGRETPAFVAALAAAGGETPPAGAFPIDFTPTPPGVDFAPRYVARFHQYLTPEQIAGRFVLIGVSLAESDNHQTPLTVADAGAATPGVEVHAQALAQILDGRRLRETGVSAELLLAVAAAAATALALYTRRSVPVRAALAAAAFLLAAAAPAAAVALGPVRLPVLPPLFASLIGGGAVVLGRWRGEQIARRRLREGFGRYVSPAVVREIEAHPDALALHGERREITCVFTDVAGFTTLCEAMPPEELTTLLNAYLGRAAEIVVSHGGTIDKFVGDAVVSFFGAPIARADHAAAAIRMAVALDRFAEDFRALEAAAGRPFGVTRIGVHSGEAVVGNFGGDVFFDYTAMGDTVNVAARLEGANKGFGGRVCISADALARAGGAPEGVSIRPVGRLRVKGRVEPLATFEAFAPDDARAATLERYRSAYDALAADPAAAAARFAGLAADDPEDSLIRLHAGRAAAGEAGDVIELKEK